MSGDLLQTKLYLPRTGPSLVSRPGLVARLKEGLHRRLTLISAPAGFGKTTLAAEWIAGCEEPVAWLSLDERDNDLTRFLVYFIAALQTISPETGNRASGMLESLNQQPPESLLTVLLNDIAAVPEGFVLVLDDYHTLDHRAIDQALAFILNHQPPRMHLVIITREDPSLPLARLRARSQLTEVRAADLRFTPGEAAEFLNTVMGLNLSGESITALENRTEGWIAGLQLAAISMKGHEDSGSFIRSFTGSHHFVMDYLIDEVLGRQPENVQAFLLRTSILDRMSGPLCDAVLIDLPASGQEVLEQLERTNLFIVPLDNQRRWYRYHHLFGDLLRQRLGSPLELPEYHLRASAWYEENNDLSEAFNHALAAGDFERSARLAEGAWQEMERSFQTAAWLDRVKKLPRGTVCSRPWLCVQTGWAFSDVGELEQSETYLQCAEQSLAGSTDLSGCGNIPGTIALIRAGNAQIAGDMAETVRYAELSVQLAPEDDLLTRSQAAITLGFTHWAIGEVEASLQAMHTWMEDMHKLGNHMYVMASAFVVADMQLTLGRLNDAEKALLQTIQKAREFGEEAEVVTAHHHLGLAMLAFERGDDDGSFQYQQTAAELGKRTTLVDWHNRRHLAQARRKESEGDWDAALDLLDKAGQVYIKNPIPILQPIAARKARVYLKQGRLDKAQAWARKRSLPLEGEVNYPVEYEYLTLVRIRSAEGSFGGLDELLHRLLTLAESQKRTGSVIEILLTQALVFKAQDRQPQALAVLERALTLAEPEGYVRIFTDEGKAMGSLIADFQSSVGSRVHPLSGYVDRLLDFFKASMDSGLKPQKVNLKNKMVDPLSDREIEVLQLIAAGHSNAEIAERLFLALSTVKGHNLRIFDKLQAQNRTEAVARGRDLGLLQP